MKTCTKCKKSKPLSDFAKHRAGRLNSRCKSCQRTISAEWYKNNKERQKSNAQRNKQKYKDRYKEHKETLSCEVCGENESACLDFHHRSEDEKDFSISEAIVQGLGWERILTEMEKCSVVCANCHRKIHAGIIVLPL